MILKINVKSLLLISMFSFIYILLSYYLGKRINTFVGRFYSNSKQYVFFIIVLVLSTFYIVYSLLKYSFKIDITWMKNLGNYWMAIFYYLVFLFFLSDIIFLLFKISNLQNSNLYGYINNIHYSGGFVVLLSAVLIVYGTFNAYNYKSVSYDIKINKKKSDINELKIAMLADLHYDNSRIRYFSEVVDLINRENVDLICLCGDIVDENTNKNDIKRLLNDLKRLKTTYGIYAVNGNHESHLNYQQDYEEGLKNIGIRLLEDETIQVNNSFYIIGRKDISVSRESNKHRLDINNLVKDINKNQLTLLLDHQPVDIKNVESTCIDLQLSGHTHKGQLFPNNLVTGLMFATDHGLYKKDDYSLIVTSGIGTWGPPVRVGSNGEVVFVKLKPDYD